MLKVTVNKKNAYKVETSEGQTLIDNQPFEWDIIQVQPNSFHILHQEKSYRADILNANYIEKTFTISLNGICYELEAQDRFDLLLKDLGLENATTQKISDLKSPMPGLVLDVNVKSGDKLSKGDTILILEAMKMENALKAPTDVVIGEVLVQKSDNVDKNQVLVRFDD